MQSPAALSLSASPAPTIKSKPVQLKYEDICYAARTNALTDFVREQRYWTLKRHLKDTGVCVQVIPVPAGKADELVRHSQSRLLKEHTSASWAAFFFQSSIYGLTSISAIGTAMLVYLGVYHNRMFLPVAPITAVVTWRLWNVLEAIWEEQRYIDNAAAIRESRRGNPMHAVVRRRKKAKTVGEEGGANPEVGGAGDML